LKEQAEALCNGARECARRWWLPATSGNFSFRSSAEEGGRIFITASGLDKGSLTPENLVEVDLDAQMVAGEGRPSAETRLHGVIYRDRPLARAVCHVHTIWNTLLSDRFAEAGCVTLEDYELLKALSGVDTLRRREMVPILENSQDYVGLGRTLEEALRLHPAIHGVLLRRHGLYTWGESIGVALRHVEALEFLFEVEGRRLRFAD
jgi:methylthioribulose-1-phosphate dehydratase